MDDKDNFLDDDWGNISDEVLDPKWKRARTKKLKDHQSKVIAKKYQDDEYYETWVEANVARWDDAEWREQHLQKMQEGSRKEENRIARGKALAESEKFQKMIKDRWADPAFKEKMRIANSKPMSEEAKKHLSEINKGKTIPQETLDKIVNTVKSKQISNQKVNKQCRTVHTHDGIFYNFAIMCNHFGISKNTILNRIKSDKEKFKDWYYLD